MLKKLLQKFSKSPKKDDVKPQEKAVEMNLDTGKLVLPPDLTPEEQAELEAFMKDFTESLQRLAPKDAFQSLEHFISSQQSGGGSQISFTAANDMPDAQLKIDEEMEFCKETVEHWSNDDLIEALLSFHNQEYDFPGLELLMNKLNVNEPFTDGDRAKLMSWYMLASQDLVYAV